ncbi:MAG TPA: helix-turn-helix domain-containing protein [Amycolatopsis sp.]|uniref:PucR family transcriptional regulator n=1 Tax=Amycolatopsis sp. TaxID=37632 RepID=UPI002B4659C9|nr:helix-turn-helix domain-containing protein [Amycolatopsis sp.]HKS45937.1 helix-turn-helix domain-containing protein [Amycolatopsis sp.]
MTVDRGVGDFSRPVLPSRLADLMRPELASVATEIVDEIRATIPAYARPLDGPYGKAIRAGVEHAISLFVAQIADPAAPRTHSHDVHRRLGQYELHAGRSLDALQAAYRVGARVSWRRIMRLGRRAGLSSTVMSQLADAILAFMDELASVALEGYLEAKASSAGAMESWRKRLLELILERPPAPSEAIGELARLVGWPVPEEVTVVAVQYLSTVDQRPLLDAEILAEATGPEPFLLVPGRLTPERVPALRAALPAARLAVGPSVPISGGADSLRWARRALALINDGMLPPQQVTWVADHLSTLVLRADAGLIAQLRQRLFAPLDALTDKQRARLLETLQAWLEAQGSVLDVAERLQIHPQTVRYRMRQLHATFGERLTDPRTRFEMELILRATPAAQERPRWPADGFRGLVPRVRQPAADMVPR